MNASDALLTLLPGMGLQAADASGIAFSGSDPVVPGRHPIGAAAAASIGAMAAAACGIWAARTGRRQRAHIDVQRATVPGLRTYFHVDLNGYAPGRRRAFGARNFFPTADGRRIYVLLVPEYVSSLLAMLDLLGCSAQPDAVAAAVARWRADELEEAIAQRKLCGVIARTREEWLAHPQGQWLAARPPIEIERIGESAPEPFRDLGSSRSPLAGVRVLDAAHVLAGPAACRELAAHGADVLSVVPPHNMDPLSMLLDTGMGKRAALVDLDRPQDLQRVRELAAQADVFAQSWRPGSLARRGLSPAELARLRPGLVYLSVSCYGDGGPWAQRGGYDPIGQAACGLAIEEGSAEAPKLASTVTLNDYYAAYLGAAGVMAALLQRQRHGGSYHVKVSLTRCSMWLQALGQLDEAAQARAPSALPPTTPDQFVTMDTGYGRLTVPAPVAQYSESTTGWALPPNLPGGAELRWW